MKIREKDKDSRPVPPPGWRIREVGETIQKGDKMWSKTWAQKAVEWPEVEEWMPVSCSIGLEVEKEDNNYYLCRV